MTIQNIEPITAGVSAALACVDRVQAFKDAMINAGIIPPDVVIGDGKLHRFKIDGKLNCAYVLHLDGRAAGYFQDFKQGIKQNWKLDGDFKPLTLAERQAFKAQCERDRLAREQETIESQKRAAIKANTDWRGFQFANSSNPYLIRKKVQPHGTKTGAWRIKIDGKYSVIHDSLILPMYNEKLELRSLQVIFPEKHPILGRDKDFLWRGQKQGCFWWIGKKSPMILIAEGFATSASLHEVTGHQVFIAFDAGNLVNVAKIVRGRNPDAEIIVCGDNDESGTGQKAAIAAALAIGGKYIIPDTVGHDWNDAINTGVAL